MRSPFTFEPMEAKLRWGFGSAIDPIAIAIGQIEVHEAVPMTPRASDEALAFRGTMHAALARITVSGGHAAHENAGNRGSR
jgi:hypothetical protein